MSISADVESKRLTAKLVDKTIRNIEVDDEGMLNYLIFMFTDGSQFRIHYDYIYSYELKSS